jgi:GNAT superfamily N-acetyltransferase
MQVRLARLDDLGTYVLLARDAQAWLESRGLRQYVPAAHDEHADTIRLRIESGTLYAVCTDGTAMAFFNLDPSASPWWPEDGSSALYLAGMVVAMGARRRGIGDFVIQWCVDQAERLGRQLVRLDCHADNQRLCSYYESHGFTCQGRVEQYPGYYGCLYQRAVSPQVVEA